MAPTWVLLGCATDSSVKAEVSALKAELRAQREANARLLQRVERLELRDQVARASTRSASSRSDASEEVAPSAADAIPTLTVVKVKPKNQPAPAIRTDVGVVEPSPELLVALSGQDDKRGEAEQAAEAMDPEVADAIFESAVQALKTGNLSGGVERLQAFASENPTHPKADNALYYSGIGQMGLDEFENAARTFERLVQLYPASDAVLDALLKLGECRVRLDRVQEAKETYRQIVRGYPGTSAAHQASAKLASLADRRGSNVGRLEAR